MAGRVFDPNHKVEKFLDREAIATQLNAYVKAIAPDADEITPERVVEVPSDGCTGHMGLGEWHTWAARWGEFLLVAIDSTGVEAAIYMH